MNEPFLVLSVEVQFIQSTLGRPNQSVAYCIVDRPQAGYSDRPDLPLPTKPPYTAHVGNLSFDANEGEISDFFSECSVSNVRLVRDKMEDRPKGFGYVEFETVEGLKKALELNNEQLAGRKVRISIAEPRKSTSDIHHRSYI